MVIRLKDFKSRRIEGLRTQWNEALTQAELLQNAGNYQHARPHLERAKELRTAMDKLGDREPSPATAECPPMQNWITPLQPDLTFTFSQDLGNFKGRSYSLKAISEAEKDDNKKG